jgi:ABC-type branched-subunit amino acid transport system ATPase component
MGQAIAAGALMTPPHRNQLLIGPPCSGKTTVAQCLVALLQKRGERARLLTPVFDRLFGHSDRDAANVLRREDNWAFQLESLIEAERAQEWSIPARSPGCLPPTPVRPS